MLGERELLLQLLETTAKEWKENYRPEDIRLSSDKLEVLVGVEKLIGSPGGPDADVLRQDCPTFVDLFQQVMLRKI